MRRRGSIPDVLFVIWNAITREQRTELFFKRLGAMVFLLVSDVRLRFVALGWPHGEQAIAALPIEVLILGAERLDEF
jgi:hypothetical protein